MKKININFFGASVTAQKIGYVYEFNKLIEHNNINNYNITSNGYGSMHIIDAGIIFINDILKLSPDICFIDWFSTGYLDTSEDLFIYIDTIVNKLLSNNCIPIFLLFDILKIENSRLIMYENIKRYAKKYNIKCIELYNINNINELLRDDVHTNDNGSKYYADYIYLQFNNYMTENNLITNNEIKQMINNIYINNIPPINKYNNIQKIDVNKTVYSNLTLNGNGEIIGIYQQLGPYSGLIEIKSNDYTKIINIWDRWCHYERNNFKLSFQINNNLTLRILNDDFDKSKCNNIIDWPDQHKIIIYGIYYIGTCEIVSIDDIK